MVHEQQIRIEEVVFEKCVGEKLVSIKEPDLHFFGDEEIKTIAEFGGVIGVIFMNYWLDPGHQENGLDLIVNTIKHIVDKGGIDSVAIGSDFDGFTDPPDDIKDVSEMPRLESTLSAVGFSVTDIAKIMGQSGYRNGGYHRTEICNY